MNIYIVLEEGYPSPYLIELPEFQLALFPTLHSNLCNVH